MAPPKTDILLGMAAYDKVYNRREQEDFRAFCPSLVPEKLSTVIIKIASPQITTEQKRAKSTARQRSCTNASY
jgi:hypothetical protein